MVKLYNAGGGYITENDDASANSLWSNLGWLVGGSTTYVIMVGSAYGDYGEY